VDGAVGPVGPTGPSGAVGPQGPPGTSVTIKGSVADVAALNALAGPHAIGDGWITEVNPAGHLHVWQGSAFQDVGVIVGPQGPQGIPGSPADLTNVLAGSGIHVTQQAGPPMTITVASDVYSWTQNVAAGGHNLNTVGHIGIGVTSSAYSVDANGDFNTTGVYRIAGVPLAASNITNALSSTGTYNNPTWLTIDAAHVTNAVSILGSYNNPAWLTLDVGHVTNAVSTQGNYSNPAWITALDWSKINAPFKDITASAGAHIVPHAGPPPTYEVTTDVYSWQQNVAAGAHNLNNVAIVQFGSAAPGPFSLAIDSSSGSLQFRNNTATPEVWMRQNGYVGIGNDASMTPFTETGVNPVYLMIGSTVVTDNNTGSVIFSSRTTQVEPTFGGTSTLGLLGSIIWGNYNITGTDQRQAGILARQAGVAMNPMGRLEIWLRRSNAWTQIVSILGTGQVGIGVSTAVGPEYNLDVAGSVNIRGGNYLVDGQPFLATASGGTGRIQLSDGAIPAKVTSSNTFVYDSVNSRLGIGITTPLYGIHCFGSINIRPTDMYMQGGLQITAAAIVNAVDSSSTYPDPTWLTTLASTKMRFPATSNTQVLWANTVGANTVFGSHRNFVWNNTTMRIGLLNQSNVTPFPDMSQWWIGVDAASADNLDFCDKNGVRQIWISQFGDIQGNRACLFNSFSLYNPTAPTRWDWVTNSTGSSSYIRRYAFGLPGDVHDIIMWFDWNTQYLGINQINNPQYPLDVGGAMRVHDPTTGLGSIYLGGGSPAQLVRISQSGPGDIGFYTQNVSGTLVQSMVITTNVTGGHPNCVGIGINPVHQLQLGLDDAVKPNGGQWTAPSDARLKRNIEPFDEGLETLIQFRPIRYEYNGEGGMPEGLPGVGLVAQEAEQVYAPCVSKVKSAINGQETEVGHTNTGDLMYMVINALKEINERLRKLEER
jgi:hypothetical protein